MAISATISNRKLLPKAQSNLIKMIAKIVVNHDSKKVDKFFDYSVPEDILDTVKVGSRVIVPFGAANAPKEGYVMEFAHKPAKKELKSIISYEDDVFDAEMAELISWMRDKYMCSYLDAIRVIVPSGISIKQEEWVVLVKENPNDEICSRLYENGGNLKKRNLADINGFSTKLKKLVKDGYIKTEFRDTARTKDKTLKVAEINVEPEELPQICDILKKRRAIAQVRILNILAVNDRISLADLVQFSETSYSAVKALEDKGYIRTYEIIVDRFHLKKDADGNLQKPKLTDEQQAVVREISRSLGEYKSFLLHGVTGSGKTEVYMRVIEECLEKEKNAIMLVPEIALTPQMVSRFIGRFGEKTAVFHSGLSLGEKYDEWKKMKKGEASIVIGARSAIFAPFQNIGAIIIDEEHEGTYKSDMLPRYNTKEIAEFRARRNDAVLLMASATPDICDYYKAKHGKLNLLEIKNRINKNMPKVDIVDMRAELEKGNRSVFSKKLIKELKENIEKKEQSILFLNRRGYSTFVSCRSCGYVAKCPKCSISMTYHKYSDNLKCHYCGHETANYKKCPECGSGYIRYFGGGTQKIEEELKNIFPDASTIRMDIDTTSKNNSHEKILKEFEEKKIDVLIGTQMITKGLDFENVTLVGVVSADVMLNIQDYRAGERTFDLIEQVTGRAGRASKKGRAVIQTYNPEHFAVTMAREHDYQSFYDYEINLRKVLKYPPYCEMVSVLFSGANENNIMQASKYFAKCLQLVKDQKDDIQVLGPSAAVIAKINNKYRWRILIKCKNADSLTPILTDAKSQTNKNNNYKDVNIVIDKNPNNAY